MLCVFSSYDEVFTSVAKLILLLDFVNGYYVIIVLLNGWEI